MLTKELLSALAIALTFIAFFPYIRSILQGKTKPHVFSWVIWGGVTLVVFLAQLVGKGGVGAWPTGVSSFITLFVVILAYRQQSDNTITRTDWVFLLLALAALPFWYLTADPMWTVIILTVVDLMGFGPTFRKAYVSPYEEQLLFFVLISIRNFVSIAALEYYSVTTVLFPAATGLACVLLIMLVTLRRKVITEQ